MSNLTAMKPQVDASCNQEIGCKRKRLCGPDVSPKKKIVTTSSTVENENAVHKEGGVDKGAGSDNYKPQIGDKESELLLEEFCDEVLYEIFKFLDTLSLLALMNVCKRWRKFVLDTRLWKNIDLSQQSSPLGILQDMLNLSNNKTKTIKLRAQFSLQFNEEEMQHLSKTLCSSFTGRCTELVTLELYGVPLDFNQITFKDFPQTLKRCVLNACNICVVTTKSLFTGIDTILVNLEEFAIENNSWFDPYYVMALSKLPLLRYLSLRGCWQLQDFIPYGSIAARHGFKQLEILDLRDTPLNDSDLQCFNAVETLKEMYLQCPKYDNTKPGSFSDDLNKIKESNKDMPTTSNASVTNANSLFDFLKPTSTSFIKTKGKHEQKLEKNGDNVTMPSTLSCNHIKSTLSLSPSLSSKPNSTAENNADGSTSATHDLYLSPNIVPLVGTNAPSRSCFLPRPDHILYVNLCNRTSTNALHVNIRDHNNLRHLRFTAQDQHQNQQEQSDAPIFEQIIRHNLFWDIVNPLGRVASDRGNKHLFAKRDGAAYHLNLFSLLSPQRQQSRGTISDRGVCCFGRTRQPAQGVIWIRFSNRPSENCFERFSVRDYKLVTDMSLQHLVQCSPHLVFLDVSRTSVTLDGLKRFKDLKPECKVVAEHLLGVKKVKQY